MGEKIKKPGSLTGIVAFLKRNAGVVGVLTIVAMVGIVSWFPAPSVGPIVISDETRRGDIKQIGRFLTATLFSACRLHQVSVDHDVDDAEWLRNVQVEQERAENLAVDTGWLGWSADSKSQSIDLEAIERAQFRIAEAIGRASALAEYRSDDRFIKTGRQRMASETEKIVSELGGATGEFTKCPR